jgi:hypothetical protein
MVIVNCVNADIRLGAVKMSRIPCLSIHAPGLILDDSESRICSLYLYQKV